MTKEHAVRPERFAALWKSLASIGHTGQGGCTRLAWSESDLAAREWFTEEALDRDLEVETDRNGNLFAWWNTPKGGADPTKAIVVGGHLDSARGGGAYTGALGVVAGLLAIDVLRERCAVPTVPIALAVFASGDGARFGEPHLGARLLTGELDRDLVLPLCDSRGMTLAEALTRVGHDPATVGSDPELLARIGAFIEPHLELGRALVGQDAPVGIGTGAWASGRWRLEIEGIGNDMAATAMADRVDPTITLAHAILTANNEARQHGAHAGIGRIAVQPNRSTTIPANATAWLDVHAPLESTLSTVTEEFEGKVTEYAGRDGTSVKLTPESHTSAITFDRGLHDRLATILNQAPSITTAGNHLAGVLAGHVPTAMVFVRNPTGVSNAPQEHATDYDCAVGVTALAHVLWAMACGTEAVS